MAEPDLAHLTATSCVCLQEINNYVGMGLSHESVMYNSSRLTDIAWLHGVFRVMVPSQSCS